MNTPTQNFTQALSASEHASELRSFDEAFVQSGHLEGTSIEREPGLILFMVIGAISLTAMYIPYRPVHLPPPIVWAGAMFLSLLSLKFALNNFTLLLVMFAVYAPFQKVIPGDFGGAVRAFNITNIFLFFIILGWITQNSLTKERLFKLNNLDKTILIFMFISTISLFQGYFSYGESAKQEHLIFPLKRWLEPMFIYFVFRNNLTDRKMITKISIAIFVTIFFCSLIALKQFFLDKNGLYASFSSLEKMRINGIADQPNQMAAFFCYYSFFFLSIFLHYIRQIKFWSFAFFFALTGLGMHLCFSRGGQLGFFAGTIMTSWLWSKRFFLLVIAPAVMIIFMAPGLLPDAVVGRMNTILRIEQQKPNEEFHLDRSSQGRIDVWKGAIKMIQDHPLMGVGYGRFLENIGNYVPNGKKVESHSTYFAIACEMGLISLLVFLVLMFASMYQALFVYRNSKIRYFQAMSIGYLGGWVGLMISNIFGSRLDSNEITFYFWILTALMVRMAELTRLEMERRTQLALRQAPPQARILD